MSLDKTERNVSEKLTRIMDGLFIESGEIDGCCEAAARPRGHLNFYTKLQTHKPSSSAPNASGN
jgi:hypothetical protein